MGHQCDQRKSKKDYFTPLSVPLLFVTILCQLSVSKGSANQEKRVMNDVFIARVQRVKGYARYRETGNYLFKDLKEGQKLSSFSTLFTGSDGEITLEYFEGAGAIVGIPPRSIFRLESELPVSTLLRRKLSRSKIDFAIEKQSADLLSKESRVYVSGVQDTGEYQEVKEEKQQGLRTEKFGIRMTLEMKRIQVTFPLNNLFLVRDLSAGWAAAPISFGGPLRDDVLGFLWQLKPKTKMVWNGLIPKGSRRIILSIDQPGKYAFQAFGESGTSRTRNIRIVVTDRGNDNLPFQSGVMRGDTVLYY